MKHFLILKQLARTSVLAALVVAKPLSHWDNLRLLQRQ